MSIRDKKAIFERQAEPGDPFSGEHGQWSELFMAFVGLRPLSGRELIDAQQVQAQVSHRAWMSWSNSASRLHPKDRFKIAKPVQENPTEPTSDANYRIFHIESVINVGERNKEIELMCKEAV